MSNKTTTPIKIDVNGNDLVINQDGDVCWQDHDGDPAEVEVTAKHLDQIAAASTFYRKLKPPKFDDTTDAGNDVSLQTDADGNDMEAGCVSIGCQNISYEDIQRVHKLSVKMRAAKKSKKS